MIYCIYVYSTEYTYVYRHPPIRPPTHPSSHITKQTSDISKRKITKKGMGENGCRNKYKT